MSLAELLAATSHAHHEAFVVTNGEDPEWPLWYAQYLQPRLQSDHGIEVTVSDLVHVLVQADRDHAGGAWTEYYAQRIREAVS